MNEEGVVYTYSGRLLAGKKNEIMPFSAAFYGGPRDVMLSELSQTEKEKYRMASPICDI